MSLTALIETTDCLDLRNNFFRVKMWLRKTNYPIIYFIFEKPEETIFTLKTKFSWLLIQAFQ